MVLDGHHPFVEQETRLDAPLRSLSSPADHPSNADSGGFIYIFTLRLIYRAECCYGRDVEARKKNPTVILGWDIQRSPEVERSVLPTEHGPHDLLMLRILTSS